MMTKYFIQWNPAREMWMVTRQFDYPYGKEETVAYFIEKVDGLRYVSMKNRKR